MTQKWHMGTNLTHKYCEIELFVFIHLKSFVKTKDGEFYQALIVVVGTTIIGIKGMKT